MERRPKVPPDEGGQGVEMRPISVPVSSVSERNDQSTSLFHLITRKESLLLLTPRL